MQRSPVPLGIALRVVELTDGQRLCCLIIASPVGENTYFLSEADVQNLLTGLSEGLMQLKTGLTVAKSVPNGTKNPEN